MARTPKTDTAAPATAATRRQAGFVVVIKAFIPMGEGIDSHIAILQAIKELTAGDLSEMPKIATDVEVSARQMSRKVVVDTAS